MKKPVKSIITVADLFGNDEISREEIRLIVPGKTALGRIRAIFAGLIAESKPLEPGAAQGDKKEVKEETSKKERKSKKTS